MPTQEHINNQLELLNTHRQTLAISLNQLAAHGESNAPPILVHNINNARQGIKQAKGILHSWNIPFEDHPNDEEGILQTNEMANSKIKEEEMPNDVMNEDNSDALKNNSPYELIAAKLTRLLHQQRSFDHALRRSMPGSSRFVQAKSKEAINRVMTALSESCEPSNLWWFQGYSHMPAQPLIRLSSNIWLVGYLECQINDLWIYRYPTLERQFVLIHLAPQQAFGIYNYEDDIPMGEEAGFYKPLLLVLRSQNRQATALSLSWQAGNS